MKLGTDVSIAECRDEGYTVIEYKVRELMPKGVMDKEHYVDVTCSSGHYGWENGRPIPGTPREMLYVRDTCCCYSAALEIYQEHKESIDSLYGCSIEPQDPDNPSPYDLLQLIDACVCYGVLD